MIALALALLATPAAEPERVGGVAIGDSVEQVQAAWPKARLRTDPEDPRRTVLKDGYLEAEFCRGAAVHLSEKAGTGLDAYQAEVARETARRGPAHEEAEENRVAVWRAPDRQFQLIFVTANGDVLRQAFGPFCS